MAPSAAACGQHGVRTPHKGVGAWKIEDREPAVGTEDLGYNHAFVVRTTPCAFFDLSASATVSQFMA